MPTMKPQDLKPGEGAILEVNGKPIAAYRDDDGTLHTFSTVCTHEQCDIEWNGPEKVWDCPCHGSRFTTDGHVANGPAEEPLTKVTI